MSGRLCIAALPKSSTSCGTLRSSARARASLPHLFIMASLRQRPRALASSGPRRFESRSCYAPPCRRP
eukprot:8650221-Pyramimonas_sp.AAC.1